MEAAITSNDNDNDNPYIALRRRNIARNEARLRELGLLRYPPQTSTIPTIIRGRNEKPKQKKATATTKRVTQIPVRRSSRRAIRPISYEDVPVESTKSNKHSVSLPSSNDYQKTPTKSSLEDKATSLVELPTQTYPENSARNISIDIHRLVSEYLAKPVTATGKSAVVEETARQFSDISGKDTNASFTKISFNKYCGVQEWKQGIFLWVNLGDGQGNGNNFVNVFLDGGRRMTWYGGSRMHSKSNAILKLLKVGRAAARNNIDDDDVDSDESDGIVLWCRRYEAEKRTFGKYHCLGRLAYCSHDPSSIPISFVWTLLDYDRLVAQKNDVVLQMIQI